MISLAGREADIVGVNANLRAGAVGPEAAFDFAAESVDEKVSWVRKAAADAGRSDDDYELQISTFMCRVTSSADETRQFKENIAAMFGGDVGMVHGSPAVLAGTVEECCDTLVERRERWGFSYIGLAGDIKDTAPIVAQLAGS